MSAVVTPRTPAGAGLEGGSPAMMEPESAASTPAIASPNAAPIAPTAPSPWASKYRGATVADLEPAAALSTSPQATIATALQAAFERDYTHLTVVDAGDRSLVGYVSMPRLRKLLETRQVRDADTVERAMVRFHRRGARYRVITLETPLAELEAFFRGDGLGEPQDFAVVTDPARRFVLGIATSADLEEFVKRRPA